MNKKNYKIIGIIIILVITLIIIFNSTRVIPNKYYSKVETGGNIESKYMSLGKYDVSKYEEDAKQNFKKYIIYYPSELENEDKKYPVVIFLNDTNLTASKYYKLLEHMASWGFIAVGTESSYDWNGVSADLVVNHLKSLNSRKKYNDKNNIFYNSIDLESVGIEGFGEGAIGAINAVSKDENSSIFKCVVMISPIGKEVSNNNEWYYDAKNVDIPSLIINGDKDNDNRSDDKNIYSDISNDKIFLIRKNADYKKMYYSADGYITAWFMYYLKNDNGASKAFLGDSAEILSNKLYKNIEKNM